MKFKEKKMAFSESLVLMQASTQNIKKFGQGNQKLFTFEEFSLLNYKESSFKDQQ